MRALLSPDTIPYPQNYSHDQIDDEPQVNTATKAHLILRILFQNKVFDRKGTDVAKFCLNSRVFLWKQFK